ncbi:MAG: 2-C-methyl-D-erythritol 4-phosphate cytidylyltransferase [Chloroflexota bacterium]
MQTPDPFAVAIIVAAGRGVRFGATPKVLAPLGGKPVVSYAIEAAHRARSIEAVVLVTSQSLMPRVEALVHEHSFPKLHAIVAGGELRQDSVAAGLAAVPPGTSLVAIHDAARPLVSASLLDACVAAAAEHGAAIAAIPVVDTLKRVESGRIVQTIPREGVWAAQTPQAFQLSRLLEAFHHASAQRLIVTDEAALFEALGWPVAVVEGSRLNLKITTADDLPIAEALLRLHIHETTR